MTIYIDVLIVINTYITYFTLKAAAALLHAGYKISRIIAASIFGGIAAVSALIPLNLWGGLLLRLLLTTALCLIAFGYSGIRRLLLTSAVATAIATFICGIVFLIREFTENNFCIPIRGYVYIDISVLTLIFSTTIVYIIISLFRRFLDKPSENSILTIEIQHGGCTVTLKAYADSGNNLRDFLSGLPVIVCQAEKIKGIMPEAPQKGELAKGVRLIPFSSVGGSGIITAFKPDLIVFYTENGAKKEVSALIGAGGMSFNEKDFDAIFNPKILI